MTSSPPPNGPAERRSVLHLVVGPSGAGKDTLIDAVRGVRPDIHVARRVITRAEDSGGEEHEAASPEDFARRVEEGGFMLHWGAHGLQYGAPARLLEALRAPQHVLLNVSRTVIDEARAKFAPVRILEIWAPKSVLARRLAARGRESEADILIRLNRQPDVDLQGSDVFRIDNSGPIEDGVAAMLACLAPPIGPEGALRRRRTDAV